MSSANPKPVIQLELSSYDFKTVIRALTGDLNRTGKKPEETEEARDLGIKLLDRYVRCEENRLKGLRQVLTKLSESEEPVSVPEPKPLTTITYLRPGSRLSETRMGHGKAGNYAVLDGQ